MKLCKQDIIALSIKPKFKRCHKCDIRVGMEFTCKFCGEIHCSDCRLPENHNCYANVILHPKRY